MPLPHYFTKPIKRARPVLLVSAAIIVALIASIAANLWHIRVEDLKSNNWLSIDDLAPEHRNPSSQVTGGKIGSADTSAGNDSTSRTENGYDALVFGGADIGFRMDVPYGDVFGGCVMAGTNLWDRTSDPSIIGMAEMNGLDGQPYGSQASVYSSATVIRSDKPLADLVDERVPKPHQTPISITVADLPGLLIESPLEQKKGDDAELVTGVWALIKNGGVNFILTAGISGSSAQIVSNGRSAWKQSLNSFELLPLREPKNEPEQTPTVLQRRRVDFAGQAVAFSLPSDWQLIQPGKEDSYTCKKDDGCLGEASAGDPTLKETSPHLVVSMHERTFTQSGAADSDRQNQSSHEQQETIGGMTADSFRIPLMCGSYFFRYIMRETVTLENADRSFTLRLDWGADDMDGVNQRTKIWEEILASFKVLD